MVGEKGKRRVSWNYNKGGPKCFKWVPEVTSQNNYNKPNVDIGPKPTVTQPLGFTQMPNSKVPGPNQPCLGFTNPSKTSFLGPSTYEVGENSSKGSPSPQAFSSTTTVTFPASPVHSLAKVDMLDRQRNFNIVHFPSE